MNISRGLKRFVRAQRGEFPWFPVEHRGGTRVTLGSEYGGWTVLREFLNRDSVVYSVGVGLDTSFDVEIMREIGCDVHAFDPTPGLGELLAEQKLGPDFHFHAVGLSDTDGSAEMRPLDATGKCSSTIVDRDRIAGDTKGEQVRVATLRTLMNENHHDRIDVLKMDIEGSEIEVIRDLVAMDIRPTQLLIEIHPQFRDGVARSREMIKSLRQAGYAIFDISARHIEYGFVLRSEIAR